MHSAGEIASFGSVCTVNGPGSIVKLEFWRPHENEWCQACTPFWSSSSTLHRLRPRRNQLGLCGPWIGLELEAAFSSCTHSNVSCTAPTCISCPSCWKFARQLGWWVTKPVSTRNEQVSFWRMISARGRPFRCLDALAPTAFSVFFAIDHMLFGVMAKLINCRVFRACKLFPPWA